MILPLSIYATLLFLLGSLSALICSKSRGYAYALVGLAIALGIIAQLVWTHPHLLTYLLPIPDALFFANLFPFAVASAAPAAVKLARSKPQKIRVGVLMTILFSVSLTGTVHLFGPPVIVGETQYWADGTCRQTSIDTCSAAATVTLLKQHGIKSTEQEMAKLALTKLNRGTHPLGIYRALKLKLQQTTSTAKVMYRALQADELISRNLPAIVNVGLINNPRTKLETRLVEEAQWQPGVVHSVVYLGRSGDKIRIADPDFGEELWPVESFKVLHRGTAIWLEVKK